MEYYLSHPERNVRLILTQFTLSEHKPLIEIGRYLKIPRDQRLCAICNILEDEFHFSSECKRNTNNRNILYQYFQNIYSNFLELNHEKKLIKILKPSTTEQIRTVTSFINKTVIKTERGRHISHNCSSSYCIFLYVVMYISLYLSCLYMYIM
jgi:hypothetical protein